MNKSYLFNEATIRDLINQDGIFDPGVVDTAMKVLIALSANHHPVDGFDSLISYHTRGFQRELFDYNEDVSNTYASMYVEIMQGYNNEGYFFEIIRDGSAPLFDEEVLSAIGVEVGFNEDLYDLVFLALEVLIKKVLMLLYLNVADPDTADKDVILIHSFNFELLTQNNLLQICSVYVGDI